MGGSYETAQYYRFPRGDCGQRLCGAVSNFRGESGYMA